MAAFFSLWPDELLRDELSQVFGYFAHYLNRSTSTFWTLLLHDEPLSRGRLLVRLNDKLLSFNEQLDTLGAELLSMLFRCKDWDCEHTLVPINC